MDPILNAGNRVCLDTVKRVLRDTGKLAGIETVRRRNRDSDELTISYASAHDLRRTFAERMVKEVMPDVLMGLMRHSSIEVTMKYYVGENAKKTSSQLANI